MPKRHPDTPNLAQTVQKRLWTQENATEVVTVWRNSGLSQRAFCERHAIEIQRLAHWAKQLPDRSALAEVVVVNKLDALEIHQMLTQLRAARADNSHERRLATSGSAA